MTKQQVMDRINFTDRLAKTVLSAMLDNIKAKNRPQERIKFNHNGKTITITVSNSEYKITEA